MKPTEVVVTFELLLASVNNGRKACFAGILPLVKLLRVVIVNGKACLYGAIITSKRCKLGPRYSVVPLKWDRACLTGVLTSVMQTLTLVRTVV
jgi:hypothetical protein